jgi:hypothetical protein
VEAEAEVRRNEPNESSFFFADAQQELAQPIPRPMDFLQLVLESNGCGVFGVIGSFVIEEV